MKNASLFKDAEMIDLTGDDDFKFDQHHTDRESESPPLIYDLTEDDADEDGDDGLRRATTDEMLDTKLGCLTLSDHHHHTADAGAQHTTADTSLEVEVGSGAELHFNGNHELFKVQELFQDDDDEWQMRGNPLIRTRNANNMLPKRCNELVALVKAPVDDKGRIPDLSECLVTRPVSSIICLRKIVFTNQAFPAHSFREKGVGYKDWAEVEEKAELVCRYKFVSFIDQVTWNVPSEALVRLRRHECDVGVPDVQLMLDWHYPTTRGKASTARNRSQTPRAGSTSNFVDLTAKKKDADEVRSTVKQTYRHFGSNGVYERRDSKTTVERFTPAQSLRAVSHSKSAPKSTVEDTPTRRPYTYADICAGAGGTTTAAQRAGFTVVFVLDHAKDPCETLRENFPTAKVLNMDIFKFCTTTVTGRSCIVVVMHISFPCQTYSVAHTHAGKDDETNEAAGYSVIPLLTKCRPRYVTFEQSPNIARQHQPSFQALIHQITELGYSVRWKVVNFADTGNVHSRNRLFVIASCPGEPLPAFPKPTHGNAPGLRPFTTVARILKQVPDDIEPHMADMVDWQTPKNFMPYNPDRPLQAAITCDGGEGNLHPSGKRPFNNQELAQLQGFPANHTFVGRKRSIMKQIGNAVPGKAATPFFREIMKSLKKFDEEVEAHQREVVEID